MWVKKRKWLIGSKMPFTHWGRAGCSRGMYSRSQYEYYYYGIRGVFGLYVRDACGDFIED